MSRAEGCPKGSEASDWRSSWKPYSSEQREDVLYNFDRAQLDILLWKTHIVCSINKEKVKQDALKSEEPQSAILIMEWAMKFL